MAKLRTSMAFGEITGRMGEMVLVSLRTGPVARRRPVYRRPTSPGQAAAAARLRRANEVWSDLSLDEAAAWRAYGATMRRTEPVSGTEYSPTGHNAFVGLALRVLQVDDQAEIPRTPPTETFVGDEITVAMRAEPGQIVWEATGPNAPGTVTELLLQRLPNVRRVPGTQFRSEGFGRFEAPTLRLSLSVEPGVYVAAYRFVRAATGQSTMALSSEVLVVS